SVRVTNRGEDLGHQVIHEADTLATFGTHDLPHVIYAFKVGVSSAGIINGAVDSTTQKIAIPVATGAEISTNYVSRRANSKTHGPNCARIINLCVRPLRHQRRG